ncbi:acyltransferase [Desulfosporosinus sp. BICA1-9]|uniref:acyltransferase n=1 Tax=Desulfosporosinus sp. BICA1-9 TaxID=1531958 RepID=UPI00054B1E35|nr:acyltransferase [Desulfosporosinus sp. BICA1-9]KJS46500.1 MAG: acyltransferase [Peptococcaceae bacterium BRH_c23]KJS78878.1 MAG: acyltransferase [Desulfosporosinus sp. BICA1-9]HBW38888.1 acyltransferase [Desulfosporosinus sp.]
MIKGRSGQTTTHTIEEINYLRGFGVVAVIAIHTTGYFTEVPQFNTLVILNLWIDIFSQFAVPLFILISGFVLAKKYRDDFSLLEFYKKRVRSIIPQYILFSVLYTVFNKGAVIQSNSFSSNFKLLFTSILKADASYHLWFFLIIIQFYLLYPILIKVYDFFRRRDKIELLVTLLLIIQTMYMVGIYTPYLTVIKINFIGYIFYFGIGIYISDHYDLLKSRFSRLTPLLLTLSLALTIAASFFIIIGLTTGYRYNTIPAYFFIGAELIYPIFRVISFLFLYNLARDLVTKRSVLAKLVHNIGVYSFGIYLIHIFFNQSMIKLLKNHNIQYDDWIFYPIVLVMTLIFSYVSVRLISFLPYSYFMIGYQAKKKTSRRT